MNIDNLINTKIKIKPDVKNPKFFAKRRSKLGRNYGIGGTFSYVIPTNDDHTVYKLSHRERGNRGFDSFIFNYALEHQGENPYLPRIYKIFKRLSNGNETFDYEMEKLIEATEIDYDFLKNYLNTIMDLSTFEEDDDENPNNIFYRINDLMENVVAVLTSDKQLIKDPLLLKIVKDNKFNDLTTRNIMFRRIKNGIQMVLSDPVSLL